MWQEGDQDEEELNVFEEIGEVEGCPTQHGEETENALHGLRFSHLVEKGKPVFGETFPLASERVLHMPKEIFDPRPILYFLKYVPSDRE